MLPYAVSHGVWNSLSSQHFPPPHMGIKYIWKEKLLQEIRNLPLTASGCQWKPASSTAQYGQWRNFVMNTCCHNLAYEMRDMRNCTSGCLTEGKRRIKCVPHWWLYDESDRVTNNKNAISCKIILVQYRIWGWNKSIIKLIKTFKL